MVHSRVGLGRVRRSARTGVLAILLLPSACQSAGPARADGEGSPDDEVWAIRCITLRVADQHQRAQAYAEALRNVRGLRPDWVQVLSDEDGTSVFYGRYRREYGPQGATDRFRPDHLRDLQRIRELSVQTAHGPAWPFYLAEIDALPTYRSAHPEWNLADADGYWSLHVAVFYNTATLRARRSAAEQYCELLRKQGEPAYFHHGTVNSSVYIGAYPQTAVVEVRKEEPLSGRVTTTLRIVDPQMIEAQQRFPISTQNGHTVYEVIRDSSGEVRDRIPTPSFPVVMPKAQRQLDQRGKK